MAVSTGGTENIKRCKRREPVAALKDIRVGIRIRLTWGCGGRG